MPDFKRRIFTHENVRRWLFNPATLVTIAGPTISDVCLWFFVASSAGQYAVLAKNPNVCALIEHRTQLYTLVVAYCFCVIELIFGVWGGTSIKKRNASTWRTTLTFCLGGIILFGALGGYLMSENVVDMYRHGSCALGIPSPGDMPPLRSPITWLRILVLLLVLVATTLERASPPPEALEKPGTTL
jgi:hypothetical protein